MLLEGWVTTVHEARRLGQSEESSAGQTSFTKLAEETEEVEGEESDARHKADTSTGDRDEVSTEAEFPRSLSPAKDFNRVQSRSDVEGLGEVGEVEKVLPDGRLDHPTSTEDDWLDSCVEEEERKRWSRQGSQQGSFKPSNGESNEPYTDFEKSDRPAQQTAGPGLLKPHEDYGASDVDTTDHKRSVDLEKSKGEEVLNSGIQIAMSQNEFQKKADDIVVLTNMAEKPTKFRTCEFENSKRCIRLGRGDQTGSKVDNFCNFHKHTRKKAYDDLGRGEQQRAVRRIRLPEESLSLLSHCRKTTTRRLPSHEERNVEKQPTERKWKFLPQLGWPTRHKTGFRQQELSQQPLRFRTLS